MGLKPQLLGSGTHFESKNPLECPTAVADKPLTNRSDLMLWRFLLFLIFAVSILLMVLIMHLGWFR